MNAIFVLELQAPSKDRDVQASARLYKRPSLEVGGLSSVFYFEKAAFVFGLFIFCIGAGAVRSV
jgi:hypothetical protein